MDYFYQFDQIQPADRSVVGDKAFYLSLLSQRDVPVVPGVVISAEMMREFLEHIHWIEPLFADLPNSSLHLDVNSPRQLQAIAQQIQQAIQTTDLPDRWLAYLETVARAWQTQALILRPSLALQSGVDPTLAHRTGGLLESQVCWVEPDAIAQGLKQVWAQLFRAKSLVYWQRSGVPLQQVKLAVLVQPLWSAIASGDVQTQATQAEIRSIWGLGQALVWGESRPDRYVVDLSSGQVKTRHRGSKTYTYDLGDRVSSQSVAQPFALLNQRQSCLQAHITPPNQQEQYALTEAHVQQLAQLAHHLRTELGHDLRLEWLIHQAQSAETTLHVVQIIPQTSGTDLITSMPETATVPNSRSPLSTVKPFAPPHSDEQQPFVLHGLAASTGQIFATAWVVDDANQLTVPPPDRVILVAANITPDWLVWINRVVGIVTEQGGMTCHGAIVAREMGIPAVVGVANATKLLHTGNLLFINGDRGSVYRLEHEAALNTIAEFEQSSSPTAEPEQPLPPPSPADSDQRRSHATQLLVNLSQPNGIPQAANLAVDGIGLLRAELMMLTALEQKHPSSWLEDAPQLTDRIASQIVQFVDAFAPRPVYYRTLDLRSNEFRLLKGSTGEPETNPMLGLHGTFSYRVDPALFDIELAALRQVQQAGHDNLHLILPFVRTVEEFTFCRQRVIQAGLTQNPHFQLWIMAEVPSVLFLLPDYVKAGVQGIAIGSNDLTHLLLGIDRDQYQIASAFDSNHPAVMRAIKQLVQTARALGIPCSVCGQLPSQHPDVIESLVRWGATAVSVNPDAVDVAHDAIARAEWGLMVDAARHSVEPPNLLSET